MAQGWILLILIVSMVISFLAADPPDQPSKPECHIPCDDICGVDIHCRWNHRFDAQIPTSYSLHWETADRIEGHVNTGTRLSGFVHREHFSMNSELRVWVQAENKHGSAKSQVVVFNTEDLTKPSPPIITWSHEDPLEISWSSICSEMHLSLGSCDVRYRIQAEELWEEDDVGAQVNYEFSGPAQPGVVYEFQVRCSCATGLVSDWSATHRIRSAEEAPTGQMDVWKDCGVLTTNADCVMTWKKLPISQAHGHIMGYEVTLFSKHSTTVLVNISVADPRGLLVCDELKCYLNSTLKSVSSASVSAYNAHGATVPSLLTIPTAGNVRSGNFIDVKMNMENLTVSWQLPSQHPNTRPFKEYVVQYKQTGRLLGKGFDWIRVNKSCTTVTFTGHFKRYWPYQVSLFTVTPDQQSHHVSSVISYSCHGIPAKVRSFKVISIAETHATLFWEPVLLSMQNGQVLSYEIGVHGQMVYNVSASPQDQNNTFELQNLSADQEYEVWIKAVTKAGPGPKVTTSFITKQQHHLQLKSKSHLLSLLIPVIICCVLVFLSFHKGASKACLCMNEKVPDPYNSTIYQMMTYQANESISWISIPIFEPHPTVSALEVVEIQRPLCEDQTKSPVSSEGCTRKHRYGKGEYSKMVDSEDEKDMSKVTGRDDCWSSTEEEQDSSGYERHFLPTAEEILNS
ncbi:interleukin 12 receptor, beta 2a, like isoform X2 [Syngnathoides biaculeatus]|uniref:interleukin 12 receptor, beta 2a, like isoform X2 n=1 Tax=Syngnathoides biaculeatus TaxID=300417 RepID=UPI002ADD9E7F|nr:interleukin 12 receptor, beta 2a, like isoform X2 [Syngnathoides biaculeatus]